ncbi:MAG: hypothetical protein AAF703_06740 [Cyanobacteria bacterium P01_D01_bin.105]
MKSQSLKSQSLKSQFLKHPLQSITRVIANFMVLRPKASTAAPMPTAQQRYSTKAVRYPYLPEGEEARDWLERLYSK